MPVAGAAEAITVSGQAPVVDSRKTETGATYGQKELQSIPTTRDPAAILRQVPGVLLFNVNVGGSDSLFQPGFVGKGSHSDQNTYNLEGVGLTEAYGGHRLLRLRLPRQHRGRDRRLRPVDRDSRRDAQSVDQARHEPDSRLGPSSLRADRRMGLRCRGRRPALEGPSVDLGRLRAQRFAPPDDSHGRRTPGGRRSAADRPALEREVERAARSRQLAHPRLPRLRQDQPGKRRGPCTTPRPRPWTQHFPAAAYRVEDSQVFSTTLFASLYFSYLSSERSKHPQRRPRPAGLPDSHQVWQYSYTFYDSKRPQYQAGVTASGFFDTGDLRHELKFGFGYKQISGRFAVDLARKPAGRLRFVRSSGSRRSRGPESEQARPELLRRLCRRHDPGRATSPSTSGCASTISRGRISPRRFRPIPSIPSFFPPSNTAATRDTPSPGARSSPAWEQRTLSEATERRFFARRILALPTGWEPRRPSSAPSRGLQCLFYAWTDANGNHHVEPGEIDTSNSSRSPSVSTRTIRRSTTSVNQIAQHLKPPTTDEFIVGAEREILPDLSAALAYTHRSVRNVEFASNQYIPLIGTSRGSYHYIGNAAGSATAADGFVLNFSEPYYGLARMGAPPRAPALVLENRPDFTETYNGVELQLVKRLSHGWMLRASFAYNDWQQHVGPGAIVDPNNLAGGINASGPVVEPIGANYINSTWQFNVSGMVQLPLGIEAAREPLRPPGLSDRVLRPGVHPRRRSELVRQPPHSDRLRGCVPPARPSSCSISTSRRPSGSDRQSRSAPYSTASTWRTATPCFSATGSSGPTMRKRQPVFRRMRDLQQAAPASQQPRLPRRRADHVLARAIELDPRRRAPAFRSDR